MSSLLTLAKDLEQQSKVQQQRTGEMLKTVFSEHEQSVRTELTESAERISSAIREHEKGMNAAMQSNRLNVLRMTGRTWLTIMMVSALQIAMCAGILWWQGEQISGNYQTLLQQKDTLAKLKAKTWGVTYLEDRDGRFLVLPKGIRADTGWNVDNGKLNAVKLVQE